MSDLHSHVTAVIWDFDGTLADTRERNMEITRRIVDRLLGSSERFEVLQDVDRYGHAVHASESWRHLYTREFGLPMERTHEAAPLWSEFHLEDETIPPLFEGVRSAIAGLDHKRQGIVSQNGRSNIEHALTPAGLLDYFEVIVADEDLPYERQKPEPDGLLHCAEVLHQRRDPSEIGTVLYVGDHPVDVECVRRATTRLANGGEAWRVLSVGVEYGRADGHAWPTRPDFSVTRPEDVLEVVREIEA